MKRLAAFNPLVISKPLAITFAAVLIVFALGIGGAKLLSRPQLDAAQETSPEAVMVNKRISLRPQPKLMVNAPHTESNASSSPQSVAPAVQIARTATMSLYVKDVQKAIAAVDELARHRRGDVLSLDDQRSADQSSRPSAQMQVRVPDGAFGSVMSSLAQAGVVRAQAITAEDLTSQIVDSSARLRNLRRTEGDILKIMDRSGSVGQILEAENQLSQVREQIETTDADVKNMLNRVRYSTIDVTLEAEVASAPSTPAATAQLATVFAAARHSLLQFTIGILGSLIWILTFAPYLVAIGLAAFVVRRRLVRPV